MNAFTPGEEQRRLLPRWNGPQRYNAGARFGQINGLDYGCVWHSVGNDFKGGYLMEVHTTGPADIGKIRTLTGELGLGDVSVQEFGAVDQVSIRLEDQEDKNLPNLLLAPSFVDKIQSTVDSARELVSYAAKSGIPMPGLSNSLTYFDAYTSGRLPLNLIQAQRDHFGSHTYERVDMEGIFHTEWGE